MKMRKGFTLVELLFVMAIIGILVGISISKIQSGKDSASLISLKSDARNMIAAQEAYASENGEYTQISKTCNNTHEGQQKEVNGLPFNLSKWNCLEVLLPTCSNGQRGIRVVATRYYQHTINKHIEYNSCTDSFPQVIDGNVRH